MYCPKVKKLFGVAMAAVSRLVVFMARCELARRSQLTKVKVLGTFHVPST
jgi:hypothetical protein